MGMARFDYRSVIGGNIGRAARKVEGAGRTCNGIHVLGRLESRDMRQLKCLAEKPRPFRPQSLLAGRYLRSRAVPAASRQAARAAHNTGRFRETVWLTTIRSLIVMVALSEGVVAVRETVYVPVSV